jgi:hypothetical protein
LQKNSIDTILNNKYEGPTVAIIRSVFLYGSIISYTNFKRRADEDMDMNKDIVFAEDELGCIFKEIKRV